ncbi:hypothetical protein EI42_06004 [Thermosporothrix hazakensis]|jgi:hypothetical protein|uniref:Major capsid protein E n=1 Tax=Thermosporothrix hazakensis TaxID=644383 RepID=A0A326TVR4_THEHA|nr:hypothetical protein [Thermosporothrix hazakensis]PZW19695.1 hypothetical protein EI42_06004 [Thermosporothrix hazakensis]GCE49193.1 hypothetical protein KTH_40620 [Thermosporothrix hazakensis]
MAYGTLQILDTLAANRTLIADYGEENTYRAVQQFLDAHNEIVNMMTSDLVEQTTDRLRRYGGVDTMTMIEGDEHSSPDVQKITTGVNVGFPLRLFQVGLQWTRKYLQTRTVAEIAAQVNAAMTADIRRLQTEIKKAIFTPTNNLNYLDRLVDNLNLPIRALLNADGTPLPPDPYGNAFDGNTHTHYLAVSALDVNALNSLINTVLEHYNTGTIKVYISQAQEAAVRSLSGFTAYVDARVLPPTTTAVGRTPLDTMNIYNRAIGVFGAAEIWVKPWIPNNYLFAYNPAQTKPLAMRVRDAQSGSLRIAAELESYPLHAQYMEREYGIAVQERSNGAVLYIGGSTYVTPTF